MPQFLSNAKRELDPCIAGYGTRFLPVTLKKQVYRFEQLFCSLRATKDPLCTEVYSRTQGKASTVAAMITEKMKDVSPIYSAWIGKSVVLLVDLRRCHVPLPCSIVGESVADLRILITPGWEMDVRKELILAVEENIALRDNEIAGYSAQVN